MHTKYWAEKLRGKNLLCKPRHSYDKSINMKTASFWNNAPCGLVEVVRHFRGALCLHTQEGCHLHTRGCQNLNSHPKLTWILNKYAVDVLNRISWFRTWSFDSLTNTAMKIRDPQTAGNCLLAERISASENMLCPIELVKAQRY
jgi:hypothetical protein